jgi:hypothetical protein
MRFDSEVVC